MLPAVSREAEVTAAAQREARLPFSLDRGPLLRTTLVRVAEQDHVLLLTLHHIVADAWSMRILVEEVLGAYEGKVALPELEKTLKDPRNTVLVIEKGKEPVKMTMNKRRYG